MEGSTAERPLLRYRADDRDHWFERDITLMGKIDHVDTDVVGIVQGPNMTTQLYLDDLLPLFGDDEDFTLAILTDASIHQDIVKIELKSTSLAYVNAAQYARFEADPELELPTVPRDPDSDDEEDA